MWDIMGIQAISQEWILALVIKSWELEFSLNWFIASEGSLELKSVTE